MRTTSRRFNPRPLRRAGETKYFQGCGINHQCFNPRPLRRAGETCSGIRTVCSATFQSTPAPKSGRNCSGGVVAKYGLDVSIHARSEERAKLRPLCTLLGYNWFQSTPAPKSGRNARLLARTRPRASFNPRPLRRAGETWSRLQWIGGRYVSIHARSEERAKL